MLDIVQTDDMSEVYQTKRGIKITLDRRRDDNLTDFGKITLSDRYLMPGESYQDLFARVATFSPIERRLPQ